MKKFLICMIVLSSVFAIQSCNRTELNSTSPEPAFDRVMKTNELRVAYISYPPSFFHNPRNNELSGIFFDVLDEIGKAAELKVIYVEETGWGTMVEAVNSGRVDLVAAGIWPNATRGKFVDFTTPIYFSPIYAYARVDDDRFNGDLSKINESSISIATIDGEMTSIVAKADYPQAKTSSLPQSTDVGQVLLEVATGKSDVTFVEPAVALEFIKNNPDKIKLIVDVEPVRVFPNVMLLAKGEHKLKTSIDAAINELMYTGKIDKIIDKYEIEDGLMLRRQLPYIVN